MDKQVIISVGREYGSGGHYVAHKIANDLGIAYYDRSILDELAKLATHYGFIDNGRMVREISARELESLCRKRTRLTVSDTTPLPAVLDRLGLAYEVRSGNTAYVYGELSVTELTLALHQAGCEIKNIHEMNETLESYYMDLMGGGARA